MNYHRSNLAYGILSIQFLASFLSTGCVTLDTETPEKQERAEDFSSSVDEAAKGFYSPNAICSADCLNGTTIELSCATGCSATDQYCDSLDRTRGGTVSCTNGASTSCPSATCESAPPTSCGPLQYVLTWGIGESCSQAIDDAAGAARAQVGGPLCEERIIPKLCSIVGGYYEIQIKYEYRYEFGL